MLLAAREQYGDDVDLANRPKKDGNAKECEGKIAPLFGASIFDNSEQIEDDGLEDKNIYVVLDDDFIKDIGKKDQNRGLEEVKNDLSKNEESEIKEIVNMRKSVFKTPLGSVVLVEVKAMIIMFNSAKKALKMEVRKYLTEQRNVLNVYFLNLVNMGFLKPNPQLA